VAGLLYIIIGLAYTEMASTYPFAGGGPYELKGINAVVLIPEYSN